MEETKIELEDEDKERIKIFKDTYNALYISHFDDNKLEYVKEQSNPVQVRLIDNLKSNRSYDFEFIEGPVSINKFKLEIRGKPKKSFYIFGEIHRDTRGQCGNNESIEFAKYLKELARNTPAFLDIYVELPMVKSIIKGKNRSSFLLNQIIYEMTSNKKITFERAFEKNKNQSTTPQGVSYTFSQILNEFRDCIQPDIRKNNKECELLRIHNIDIRSTWDIDDVSMVKDNYVIDIIRRIFTPITKKTEEASIREIILVLNRINDYNGIIVKGLERLIKNDKIDLIGFYSRFKPFRNQLAKSSIREQILKCANNRISETIDIPLFIQQNKLFINMIKNKSFDKNFNYIMLKNTFAIIDVLATDIYCLSRIFKSHNLKKSEHMGEFQPVESKNIIIYVGDSHAKNYISFLQYLGFEPTYSYKNSRSCVYMNHPLSERKLKKMNRDQLEFISKRLKIDGYQELNKLDLINAIIKLRKDRKMNVEIPYRTQSLPLPSPPKSVSSILDLLNMKVIELRNVAKKLDIKGISKFNKSDLIKEIRKQMKIERPPSPPKLQVERPPSPPKLQVERPPSPPKLQVERSPSPPKLQVERPPSPPKLQVERPPSPPKLLNMKVNELRILAQRLDMTKFSKLKKSDLIREIEKRIKNQRIPSPSPVQLRTSSQAKPSLSSLKMMTVVNLRVLVRRLGCKGHSKYTKKDELINFIINC
jgi:hypothetical protein